MISILPVKPATSEDRGHELSIFLWLWLPLGFFVLRYLIAIFTHKNRGLEFWLRGELGLVENLTVLLLVMSVVVTAFLIHRFGRVLNRLPILFLVVFCIGCIYFAGEEASWGQHWIGWETGEYFSSINDQNETNLHNTTAYLDRIPKSVVSLAIFIGGIFFPIYFRRKSLRIDCTKPMWWLFPTWICLPTALIATMATWPSKIERATGWVFYYDQAQEMKELYIAFFSLLFIVSLFRRLQHYKAAGTEFSSS